MSKMLGAERVLCHSLLLDMTSERVLVHESIPVAERVLWTLDRKSHIAVRDIHVHLRVCRTCYKRGLIEWVLVNSFALTKKRVVSEGKRTCARTSGAA
jgi:hypothetical protein